MKKTPLMIIVVMLTSITATLAIAGLMFQKEDNEKQNGLSHHFDISSQGTIAYVSYQKGKPQLHLYNEKLGISDQAYELDNEHTIVDPSFSQDGSTLAFVAFPKDLEEEKKMTSKVYLLDLRTKEVTEAFSKEGIIMEVEYSSVKPILFYLSANTYTNYSPIASKRPHGLDIFQYDLETNDHQQVTELEKYSMSSLTVSPNGEKVYVQMDDDDGVETAEDSFNVHQRIFEIPLDNPTHARIVTNPNREVDIFTFNLTPTGSDLIFQSIANAEEGGTFEYELYQFHMNTNEETQLTNLGEYTTNPVVTADGKEIYFVVDKKFGQNGEENHLYKMSIDGKGIEEVMLFED
ncbi:hypothetical protein LS684_03815 [Cytobacillus spongiae]|uniref:TolB family protein n=1 Tax=Cytobacillus spongiae TaxID=2901381 RepID=UPI001F2ECBFF|nr:hypothetical protein [Cytobacillus spongiae]UII56623.1 hypothetical protein LS684_03815 [Cytobacillus spongiae]